MRYSSIKKIIRDARDLISNPDRWTKGEFARNQYNEPCSASNPGAVKFCLLGALERTVPYNSPLRPDRDRAQSKIREAILRRAGHVNIFSYNDAASTTHADVINLLDEVYDSVTKEESLAS